MQRKLSVPYGVNNVMQGKHRVRVEMLDDLFCVHKTLYQRLSSGKIYSHSSHWTLTHVPSMHAVAKRYPSKEAAIKSWKKIRNMIDWTFMDIKMGGISKKDREYVSKAVRDFR